MNDIDDMTSDRVAGLLRHQAGTLFGKYRGTVSTVGTADDLGRIKAFIPAVLGEHKESIWIEPAVPFAGNKHGIMFLPEQGDGVWIEFEAGHPWLPIWTGFWWGKNQKPQAERSTASEYGFLKIRYKLPDSDTSQLIEQPIQIASREVPQNVQRDVQFSTAVAGFGQLLRGGTFTGPLSYDEVIRQAQAAKGDDAFGYRTEFVQLVRKAKVAREM